MGNEFRQDMFDWVDVKAGTEEAFLRERYFHNITYTPPIEYPDGNFSLRPRDNGDHYVGDFSPFGAGDVKNITLNGRHHVDTLIQGFRVYGFGDDRVESSGYAVLRVSTILNGLKFYRTGNHVHVAVQTGNYDQGQILSRLSFSFDVRDYALTQGYGEEGMTFYGHARLLAMQEPVETAHPAFKPNADKEVYSAEEQKDYSWCEGALPHDKAEKP